MSEIITETIKIVYGFAGIAGVIAYWPTIKDLHIHKKPSANVTSYVLWVISMGIALLYSVVIVKDILLIIVSLINFSACALVLGLTLKLQKGKIHRIKTHIKNILKRKSKK